MAQVTRASWAVSLLKSLELPATRQNIIIIMGWEAAEGGAGPQFGVPTNAAAFNPLNTTQPEPGSRDTNPAGQAAIQAYTSWESGLKATVSTLSQSNMAAIVTMLQPGTATPEAATKTINGSPWGTTTLTAGLIVDQSATAGGQMINPVRAGGVAGMGGTGTTGNQVGAFYVGDSMNPDMDYWTCINQYSSEAQLYCFSDGETLYLADGTLLAAQTPALTIAPFDPKVISLEITTDNTSFQFATTHRKKANVVRRATMMRTMSPTGATLKVICNIDDYRAGDVVYLTGTGQFADGPWLVAQCERSIFQVFSTLTLTLPMMPLSAVSGEPVGAAVASVADALRPGSGVVIRAMLNMANTISSDNYPYVRGGGHPHAGSPSTGSPGHGYNGVRQGFDCSGAVAAVLAAGGVGIHWGDSVPDNDGIIRELMAADVIRTGQGTGNVECTLFNEPGTHIYMRLDGRYWGSWAGTMPANGYGIGWCPGGYPMSGFTAYHVKESVLRSYIRGTNASFGSVQ